MTLSTAESCTGGRIAAAITAHSGASNYFRGGLVAYQNDVKEEMLGVAHEMIAEDRQVLFSGDFRFMLSDVRFVRRRMSGG